MIWPQHIQSKAVNFTQFQQVSIYTGYWFGTRGSEVQILSPRPYFSSVYRLITHSLVDPLVLAQVPWCRKVRQYWAFRQITNARPSTRISTVRDMNPIHTQTDNQNPLRIYLIDIRSAFWQGAAPCWSATLRLIASFLTFIFVIYSPLRWISSTDHACATTAVPNKPSALIPVQGGSPPIDLKSQNSRPPSEFRHHKSLINSALCQIPAHILHF
jgi:hypothetical protein